MEQNDICLISHRYEEKNAGNQLPSFEKSWWRATCLLKGDDNTHIQIKSFHSTVLQAYFSQCSTAVENAVSCLLYVIQ